MHSMSDNKHFLYLKTRYRNDNIYIADKIERRCKNEWGGENEIIKCKVKNEGIIGKQEQRDGKRETERQIIGRKER